MVLSLEKSSGKLNYIVYAKLPCKMNVKWILQIIGLTLLKGKKMGSPKCRTIHNLELGGGLGVSIKEGINYWKIQ